MWLLAHEKWFIDAGKFPLRLGDAFRWPSLGYLLGVVLVTFAAWVIWRLRGRHEIIPGALSLGADRDRLAGFYGLVPAILGAHLAVQLLVSGILRNLFSANIHFDGGAGYLIGPVEVGCALCLFYGALTRLAAALLALLWLFGLVVAGPQPMLDNAHILGYAGFFFFAGRGPISIDRLIFPRLEPRAQLLRFAVPALRIGLGLSLAVVAFTEKFANMPMAEQFLRQYPVNFTPNIGLPLSDRTFIFCGGATELLIGLLLIFNIFPRLTLIIAWVPFNLTLSYFNWNSTEFIGHLPIYGAVAVLMIWGPEGEHEPLFKKGIRDGFLHILSEDRPSRAEF